MKLYDSKCATQVSKIILESCPTIFNKLKQNILNNADNKANQSCKRNNRSVLHHNTYEKLENFDMEIVVDEMLHNFPFLTRMLLQISCKGKMESSIKPKLCMIYSILMNSRWYELGFFKKIITILLIEGGASKKVRILKTFFLNGSDHYSWGVNFKD